MRPIRKLVEAMVELSNTGRLAEDTKADLFELIAAENYAHPAAVLEVDDADESR